MYVDNHLRKEQKMSNLNGAGGLAKMANTYDVFAGPIPEKQRFIAAKWTKLHRRQ